jgi:putative oxidoreductase
VVAGALVRSPVHPPAAFSPRARWRWLIGWRTPRRILPRNNGGDAAILFCFVFLYLVFAGAGALSVDTSRRPVP